MDFIYDNHFVSHVVHITFMLSRGRLVPWTLVITEVEDPHDSHSVGLRDRYCPVEPSDLRFNRSVERDFPRRETYRLDRYVRDVGAYFVWYHHSVLLQQGLYRRVWLGATDYRTYLYLRSVYQDIVLLSNNNRPVGAFITTAFAQNILEDREDDMSVSSESEEDEGIGDV